MMMLLVVAAAGLFVAAPVAGAEQLDTTVSGAGIRARTYSSMCDNGFQHTRINVRNDTNHPVAVTLSDPQAKSIEFRPSGRIPAGTAQAISITAAPNAPGRTGTLNVDPGGPVSVDIPFTDCCPLNPQYASCTTVEPTRVINPPVVPVVPFDPPKANPATVSPASVTTAVKSGTLPFTGSDVRFISAVAAILVIVGGTFMLIQSRIDSSKTLLVGEELNRRGIFGPY
jgi:hypothetical protein